MCISWCILMCPVHIHQDTVKIHQDTSRYICIYLFGYHGNVSYLGICILLYSTHLGFTFKIRLGYRSGVVEGMSRGVSRGSLSHVGGAVRGAVQRCRDVAVKPRAVGRVAHKSRPVGASRLHVHVSYDHPVGSGARQGSTRHRRSTERRPPAPPGWSIGHTGARRVPSPKTRDRDDEIIHRPPTRLRATSAVGSHRDPRPEICL